MPVVLMYTPPLPSITFVSPATMHTPASFAVFAIDDAIASSVSVSAPSSMMNADVMYFGTAPLMSKSFTVPQTASLPMSPPLKNRGVTTKLSVVIAILP